MYRSRHLASQRVVSAFLVTLGTALPQFASAELFTLRVGSGHPAGPTVYVTVMRDFVVPELRRRVAEETEHELRIIEGYAGSIASVSETLEAVQIGMLDIGGYCVCFEPAKLFLHNFQYFVPFGQEDAQDGIRIARQVYDENPWLADQLEKNYGQLLLGINGFDNYHLGTTIPWGSIEDLSGVKIAGAGPNLPWLEFAGVVPVQSQLPEGYMAMSTGVVSGWLLFPSAYFGYKYHEPAPYFTLIGFGAMGGATVLTMNTRTLERLPSDIREIVLDVGRQYEVEAARALEQRQIQGLQDLRDAGATVQGLPEEVRRQWAQSLAEFPNRMAKEADSRGMPGSQVLSSYIGLVTDSGYEWPVTYIID